MKLVIQRVSECKVVVEKEIVGAITKGLLVLLGITHTDTSKDVDYLIKKLLALRIFEDQEGKMNLSVTDIKGEILVVSQFTLYGDTQKGNRPSFIQAAKPELAIPLYEEFLEKTKKYNGFKSSKWYFWSRYESASGQ
ncbi:MAG: D-aminoacyl-tRNA deacylase [Bacteroidia bacterium]|nr:MAG: D-aminoacyl-tRNA deacylase [Bacteroidia bacterium]